MPLIANVLSAAGPGILAGMTLGDWLLLLRENRFAVAKSRVARALTITSQALQNSAIRPIENARFGRKLKDIPVQPPVFILGHWRNGTTYLHNLLTNDERFAFPNMYQVLFPHTFLCTETTASRVMSVFLPKRRPMDNVEWSWSSPQEDEFALCILTRMSPCMGWMFPDHRDQYDRHLTFREVSRAEVQRWREAFLQFARKLTWKHGGGRPLVFKSPPHTARIRLLSEMFPGAKFVHIHRDPFTVFSSSRRTFEMMMLMNGLQRPRLHDLEDWILRQYQTMYDAFFEERSLIPQGHYHELGFEQLEKDPIREVRRLYESLDLPDFRTTELALGRFVSSLASYQKNVFADLPDPLRVRIAEAWRPCFDEWEYAR